MSTLNQMQVGGVVYDIEDSAAREEANKLKDDIAELKDTTANWEVIAEGTLSEDATGIEITKYSDGSALELKEFVFDVIAAGMEVATWYVYTYKDTVEYSAAKLGYGYDKSSMIKMQGNYLADMVIVKHIPISYVITRLEETYIIGRQETHPYFNRVSIKNFENKTFAAGTKYRLIGVRA